MKKIKIDIPNSSNSTYYKSYTTDTKKIKRIPEENNTEAIHDHVFVGENEFIIFLKNPIEVSDAMKIISINETDTYTKTTTKKISKSSDISTIIQD